MLLLFTLRVSAHADSASIQLKVKPQVTLGAGVVRIGDVAEVISSSELMANQVRQLDVERFGDPGIHVIDAQLLELRVLLSDVRADEIRLTGAKAVSVTISAIAESADARVEQLIRHEIAERFHLAEAELSVKLLSPLDEAWTQRAGAEYEWDVVLPDALPLGRRSVLIRCLAESRLVATRQLSIDVKQRQQVLVTAQDLPIGHVMTPDDVRLDMHWSSTVGYALTAEEILSRRTTQRLLRGTPLTTLVLSPVIETPQRILVKQREPVTVSLRKGNLQVTLQAAEAVQQGQLGDRILLRNLESKRLITGVVTGPGQVLIDLDPATAPVQLSNSNANGPVQR